jgi:hypothetical protein
MISRRQSVDAGPDLRQHPVARSSRREFLRRLAGAGLTATVQGWSKVVPPQDPLTETAKRFHSFVVDRMLDGDGLCRSFLNLETLAPFTNAQLAAPHWQADLTDWFQNAPDKAACLSYENSLMATGEFGLSQVVRFRVTGSSEARSRARSAMRAILAVVREGAHYMPGYLPKPFGGIDRARYSHELSPDQYTKALVALAETRPLANRSEAEKIERFFVDAADFFIARKFRHAYRHRTIVAPETHLHALGLHFPLLQLAANVSANRGYLAHLAGLGPLLDAATTAEVLANFNMASLLIEGFSLAIRAGNTDPRLPSLIRLLWERSARNIDENGDAYDDGRPERKTAAGTRIAAVAPLVRRLHPEVESEAVARRILRRLTGVRQMEEYRVKGAISDTSITSWLLAYWRLQERTTG